MAGRPRSDRACSRGHLRNARNTYVNPNKPGQRMCRLCNSIAKARRAKALRFTCQTINPLETTDHDHHD